MTHCVTGNTLVTTEVGELAIGPLRGLLVQVWNGSEFSPVVIRKSGEDQIIYRVHLSNESHVDCAANHTWYVEDGDAVATSDLYNGLYIEPFTLPDGEEYFVEVTSIEELPDPQDTYGFSEPLAGRGTFNGVVTGV